MTAGKVKDVKHQAAVRLPQYIAAFIANIGAFSVGTCRGWTSTAEYPLVKEEQFGFLISETQFSWIGSLTPLGCILGSLILGWTVTKYGRKSSMLLLCLPSVLGYLMIGLAQNVAMLYVGRLVVGMTAGGYGVAIPLYLGEILDAHIRGTIGVFFQFCITSGILFTYIVGSIVNVSSMTIFCGLIPLTHGILVTLTPESPIYFLEKNKGEEARKALQWLRGSQYNIDEEIARRQKIIEEVKAAKLTWFEAFSTKSAKKGLLVCIGIFIFRQLSGISGIIFYTNLIFKESGSTIDSNLETITTGFVDLIFTFISSRLIDRLGRRPLLLFSGTLMGISTFFIGLFFLLKDRGFYIQNLMWMPLTFLCLFIVAYSSGFGPLPWVFMGEMFPRRIAGYAASITCMVNFFFGFLVTHYFYAISSALGEEGVFFIFTGFSSIAIVFVYVLVPETKNKSVEEILKELES